MNDNFPHLTCPICQHPLTYRQTALQCENHHSFDIAKEGYVNLLPVQHKNSKAPGDNKSMISARRDFLNKHFYKILADKINEIVEQQIIDRKATIHLLDSGCGEGYFTQQIKKHNEIKCTGMDISKAAIKIAARRTKDIHWMVGSSSNIPVEQNSLDIVLKINAPLDYQQLKSKLSEDAIVISITPGNTHLAALRSIMYENTKQHKTELCPDGYITVQSSSVSGELQLTNKNDIHNLFLMTPYYWNASANTRQNVAELNQLKTPIAFDINIFAIRTETNNEKNTH